MRDWRLVLRDMEREESRQRSLVKNVPGELRNQKCPCGSGRKAKNCQCDAFKGSGIQVIEGDAPQGA